MSKNFEQYNRRKLISSYFSVTISITLVLFLLGFLGIWIFNTLDISDNFKEKMTISVILNEGVKEKEISNLEKKIAGEAYCKSVMFVSKEKAADNFMQELGEDFISFIGKNPLKNSLELNVKSEFVTPDELQRISKKIAKNPIVNRVVYDSVMVEKIHNNIQKISLIILLISSFFTLIAVALINASIRLSIYSKRFIIKTMQLVGATKKFIRKPFAKTYLLIGVIGWFFSSLLLLLCLYQINSYLPDLQIFNSTKSIVGVFIGTFSIGIFIVWISTYTATQRFLNLHTDDLY